MTGENAYLNEYPLNLLIDVYEQAGMPFDPAGYAMTEDQRNGLEQAIFSLSARLQRFLRKRYLEGQSCRAIAVSEDISEARVRTALHRLLKNLSRPENMDLIQNGLQIVLEKQRTAIAGIIDDPRAEEITLEQLNLTVRSYNLLKAAELFTEERINETVVKYYEGGDGNEYRGSEVLMEPDKYWNGYRDFVIDYYEQYPEDLDAFNELVNQLRRRADEPDWKGIDAEIDNLIASKFHYTRKPGKTPEGMDFVENFVKTKRGFCVHFATLSTLLYRAMGIPARYVEGYAVPKDAFHTTGMGGCVEGTIDNKMAHAWCEVYDENMGWIPKEHTPGYVEVEKKQGNNKPIKNQAPSTTKTAKETTTAKIVENTTVQSTETVTKKDEKLTVVSGKTETEKAFLNAI